MRILVVGLGNIARRHIRNLRSIDPAVHIGVWRQRGTGVDPELAAYIDQTVYEPDEVLAWSPEAALITNPASLHVQTGLWLAAQRVHLFIEKPLSHSMDGVDDLLQMCDEHSLVLTVGYNFRFSRPLQVLRQALQEGRIGRPVSASVEVGQFLPEWRPGDYRVSASARQALGGGVVFELSHEVDYIRWLMGEIDDVLAHVARVGDLEIDAEDTADIIVQFRSGAVGNIHLDMLDRARRRSCRIVGTNGTLLWDADHRVRLWADGSGWNHLHDEPEEMNAMYLEEMRHFLHCVDSHETPAVSGQDGRRVLEILLAAKESAATRRAVSV